MLSGGGRSGDTVKKAHEKMEVAETKMLRWMCGVTRLDKIRNEKIRGSTKVGQISKKVQERRMRWYGHVMRRDEEYVEKRVMGIEVRGSRRRGRPKMWADCVKDDLRETVRRGGVRPSCMEETIIPRRPHIEVG